MEWLVLADDLTGACDTGAAFTRSWPCVKVALNPEHGGPAADVLVISSESRALDAARSAAAVSSLWRSISPQPGCWIYKKIDSTLRGNPWSELEAVMEASNNACALVAPAFPEQERVLLRGQLFVKGVEFEKTAFALESTGFAGLAQRERLRPRLLTIEDVRRGVEWIAQRMLVDAPGTILADAETSDDLGILARWFLSSGLRLACGSAGLARGLAAVSEPLPPKGEWKMQTGPVLIVAGSRHPATLNQVSTAAANGMRVVIPAWDDFRIDNWKVKLANTLGRALEKEGKVILSTSSLPHLPGQELKLAHMLAQIVASIPGICLGGLVLTGGEIAYAVLRALRCDSIILHGEITPGIPWGHLDGGMAHGARVVTKAGGFGAEEDLLRAVSFLSM